EERASTVTPIGWTADGRFAWGASGSNTDSDPRELGIFVRSEAAGSRQPPTPFRTGFPVGGGRVSPDGRYIAYQSGKTGKAEVYVDTFPTPASHPDQISVAGGIQPRWRGDGKELYFVDGDQLMAKEWPASA